MSYRLCKTLSVEDVREVCISHQYYTRGDSRAYEEMFSLLAFRTKTTGSNITSVRLEDIAQDIKDHSDTEDSVLDIMESLACHIRVTVVERP